VEAYKGDTVLGETLVIVAVPAAIGYPHDAPKGNVAAYNLGIDATTSPAWPAVPARDVALVTVYLQETTIQVNDQFGNALDDIYVGQAIMELFPNATKWISINQNISAGGVYSDPIGCFEPLFQGGGIVTVQKNSPQHLQWQQLPPQVPLARHYEQIDLGVLVGGHELDPGIVDRTWRSTPPARIDVIWP
jgi:hypothetical protein